MLERLFAAIAAWITGVVAAAVAKARALENTVELVTAVLGLACIALGLVALWTGHTS